MNKEMYVEMINDLMEKTNNLSTLDLIYKILVKCL